MLGLTTAQAEVSLKKYGLNEIPEPQHLLLKKILRTVISPISLMLVLASALSFFTGKSFDGFFILALLVLNVFITLWQEFKADTAIKKLNSQLSSSVLVSRDGAWVHLDPKLLTVGDVLKLSSGEVVPADTKVLEAENVTVNESALTGESFPQDKEAGAQMLSGSFLVTGVSTVEVTAVGPYTKYGKTISSVERIRKESLLEKDILKISKYLTTLSLVAVVLLTTLFILNKQPVLEILTLDLSLVIAGIPISLPTVMSLIIEIGVISLAGKNVIVRRLTSLEDLSNVDFLLTDKTGTLTQNKIEVNDIYAYSTFTHDDVLNFASVVCSLDPTNTINQAVLEKTALTGRTIPQVEKVRFIPADSTRKRSTLIFRFEGTMSVLSFGAPQVIKSLCGASEDILLKFDREVEHMAVQGYRTLALAIKHNSDAESNMSLVGVLSLSDTLRPEAKDVVEYLEGNGIKVSMVTGDNRAIASQIASNLCLGSGVVVPKQQLDHVDWIHDAKETFSITGAYAEILPEDKLMLVEQAKRFFTVASNGDGVNDLPAVKAANVGIAVSNAVPSLKSAADIVLLTPGISVIKDAIIESRKIFERVQTYSLYRISESFRLIITVAILGLIFKAYPLSPLQMILLAFLNDIPIISLAFDRVNIAARPAKLNIKKQLFLSSLFGLAGVGNSLLLIVLVNNYLHLSWALVQTIYFLKLTVSGHMLIFVAHTKEPWHKFLPSKEVIIATLVTQGVATGLALTGFLMPSKLPLGYVAFIWIWAFFWMQISELMKRFQNLI